MAKRAGSASRRTYGQILSIRLKKPGTASGACIPSLRGTETGAPQEFTRTASLAKWGDFWFSERPCLKAVRWRIIEGTPNVFLGPPYEYKHLRNYMHMMCL